MSDVKAKEEGKIEQSKSAATCFIRMRSSVPSPSKAARATQTYTTDKDDSITGLSVVVDLADPRRSRKNSVTRDGGNQPRSGNDGDTHVLSASSRETVSKMIGQQTEETNDEKTDNRNKSHDELTTGAHRRSVEQYEGLRRGKLDEGIDSRRAEEEENEQRLSKSNGISIGKKCNNERMREQLTNPRTAEMAHDQNTPRAAVRLAFLVSSAT